MSFSDINISEEYEIPVGDHVGAFGTARKHDVHKGVDLYTEEGALVFAVEDGVVCNIRPFTGKKAGCPWWLETDAVSVAGKSGIIVYGEIEIDPCILMGRGIREGTLLGKVKRVLKEDKGRPICMLHLALHNHGVQSNGVWKRGEEQPEGLLDPTAYLMEANK